MKLSLDNHFGAGLYHTVTVEEDHLENDAWYDNSLNEVDAWCVETFGVSDSWGDTPYSGWKRMRNVYFFIDKSKKDWFVIRWS